MSWFGGGGGGGKSERNESTYRPDSYQQDQSFVEQQESYVAPGGAGGISASLQQALVLEQQNALIQAVIFKLSDIAVRKCITSPSTSLSSSKWLISAAFPNDMMRLPKCLIPNLFFLMPSLKFLICSYPFPTAETNCIRAVTGKFVDTSEIVAARLSE